MTKCPDCGTKTQWVHGDWSNEFHVCPSCGLRGYIGQFRAVNSGRKSIEVLRE